MTLCDSKVLQLLSILLKKSIHNVIPGSDLTQYLFESFFNGDEEIMILGSTPEEVNEVTTRYNLVNLYHYAPSMGFINKPHEVEDIILKVMQIKPRYLFLALGFPRQEMLACELIRQAEFDCTAFCVGASIDFLTGKQKRAPESWQRLRLEWLYRFFQQPRRLFRRYFVESWAILPLIIRELKKENK